MTRLPFTELVNLPDEVVLTYFDVLEQAEKAQRKARRG